MGRSTNRRGKAGRVSLLLLLLLAAGCAAGTSQGVSPPARPLPEAIELPSPSTLPATLPTAHPRPVPDGWTIYPGVNDVQAAAFAPDGALWAATNAGVVRWNLTDGTHDLYSTADGLASNLTTDVAIAPDGSVWVATLGGVSRLQGGHRTIYTQADGLPNNAIQAIAVTPQGQVWAGTTEGASRFDPAAGGRAGGSSWTGYLAGARVWDMDVAPDGSVWLAADGLGVSRYSPAGEAWTTYTTADGLPGLNVTAVAASPAGEAWAYATWQGTYHFDGARWQRVQEHGGLVCALAVDAGGAPWMGECGSLHYSWGKLRYGQGDGWVDVTGWHELGTPPIQAIAVGPDGRIAVGTDRGLSIAGEEGWQTLLAGPIRSQVTTVAVTPDGAAWFGFGDSAADAAGGGLSRFDGLEWQHFLDDANVQALAAGSDGTLWAGGGCQVWRLSGGDWQQMAGCEQITGNVLDIAVASDGAVWVATGLALARFDPLAALRTGGRSWTTYDRLAHSVALGADGILWAVGWEGTQGSNYVARFDGSAWTQMLDRSLGSLVVTPDGHVWGVAGDRELAHFDGQSWTLLEPSAGLGPIRTLAIAPDGALWASGNDQIARLDGGGWTVYPSVEGVQAIAFAPEGSLWLGTSGGAAHFQWLGAN